MSDKLMLLVAADVVGERRRQESKWGEQNREPADYYAILAEEFGEIGKAINELRALKEEQESGRTVVCGVNGGMSPISEAIKFWEKNYLDELLHTSAVAQAMIECALRKKQKESVTRETVTG